MQKNSHTKPCTFTACDRWNIGKSIMSFSVRQELSPKSVFYFLFFGHRSSLRSTRQSAATWRHCVTGRCGFWDRWTQCWGARKRCCTASRRALTRLLVSFTPASPTPPAVMTRLQPSTSCMLLKSEYMCSVVVKVMWCLAAIAAGEVV